MNVDPDQVPIPRLHLPLSLHSLKFLKAQAGIGIDFKWMAEE